MTTNTEAVQLSAEAMELAKYFESQSDTYAASDSRFDAIRLLRTFATSTSKRDHPDDLAVDRFAAAETNAVYGVAPGAPQPEYINLEGLREKLLAPREIARDKEGWLVHPDLPVWDEDVRVDKFLEAFRIEAAFVSMENDACAEAYETYFERGDADCSAWTPTAPAGAGWMLLEIYDTEDGPYALFGRDWYSAEQERKKEHTRKLRDAVLARRAASSTGDQGDS
nr:hypothetical protein HUO10_003268 [Paraburkholderia busanensis]